MLPLGLCMKLQGLFVSFGGGKEDVRDIFYVIG